MGSLESVCITLTAAEDRASNMMGYMEDNSNTSVTRGFRPE